jgi:hypothetical protein
MSKTLRRILFTSLLALVALAVLPTRAGAAPPPSQGALRIESFAPIAVVEGAPPSASHTRGTAIVAWIHASGDNAELMLAEWDVARDAVSRQRAVAPLAGVSFAVALSRAGGGLSALVSGPGADRAPTSLFAIDDTFAVKAKLDFAEGGTPSLDGDERYLVATTFESRTPTLPRRPDSARLPPDEVLVARVVDRTAMTIVGARVFRGPQMLRSATRQLEGGSSVRVVGGRAFFGLPDVEPVVVATRLPSLTTIARRETPRAVAGAPTVVRLTRLGDGVVAATAGRVYALGPSLEPRGRFDCTATSASYDARTGKLLTDVPCGKALGAASASTPKPGHDADGSVVAWIFGRATAFAPDDDNVWRALAR